jgi:hypothetical protein
MLAYLLWHRPAEGVGRETYEHASQRFHRSLHHSPPVGFHGSAVFALAECPWFSPSHERAYEDWYLIEDFAALGVLNEAAVAHGHRGAHDEIARRFGAGAGGLYGLLEGHADLLGSPLAVWVTRPPGAGRFGDASEASVSRFGRRALGELLGDGMDPEHASLWRRALVFGPAPEYCLLTRQPISDRSPTGVAPTRLPKGWRAVACEREMIWGG